MAFLIFRDLTTARSVTLPVLPVDGSFTLERAQNLIETPVLAGRPVVQVGAPGAARLSLPLEIWAEQGERVWQEYFLPSFGGAGSGYTPHLVQIAWGNSSEDAFTGRPQGMPPTVHRMGDRDGTIFSRSFEYVLVETISARPTFVSRDGRTVRPPSLTHVTKAGETLFTIARFYQSRGIKTTVEKIALANGGNPPMRPYESGIKKLVIPK